MDSVQSARWMWGLGLELDLNATASGPHLYERKDKGLVALFADAIAVPHISRLSSPLPKRSHMFGIYLSEDVGTYGIRAACRAEIENVFLFRIPLLIRPSPSRIWYRDAPTALPLWRRHARCVRFSL